MRACPLGTLAQPALSRASWAAVGAQRGAAAAGGFGWWELVLVVMSSSPFFVSLVRILKTLYTTAPLQIFALLFRNLFMFTSLPFSVVFSSVAVRTR